jgi:hypothetical protein
MNTVPETALLRICDFYAVHCAQALVLVTFYDCFNKLNPPLPRVKVDQEANAQKSEIGKPFLAKKHQGSFFLNGKDDAVTTPHLL